MYGINDYPASFYFGFSIPSEYLIYKLDAGFKEVSGISKEFGIEEVRSGGENRFKYRLPTVVTSKNLVLKRAAVPIISPLVKWCKDCVDGGLSKPIKTKDVCVSLYNNLGVPLIWWNFYGAYPVKYSVSDLKSQESEILIETLELAFNYFDTPSGVL